MLTENILNSLAFYLQRNLLRRNLRHFILIFGWRLDYLASGLYYISWLWSEIQFENASLV